MRCSPRPRLTMVLVVFLFVGFRLGWCQTTIDCTAKPNSEWSRRVKDILCKIQVRNAFAQARAALAKANDEMFKLQSKDSLFAGPSLAVNSAYEQFQVEEISPALALLKLEAARGDTDNVARRRADRLSPWKGREGDAFVGDVTKALQLIDSAAQKLRELQ